MNLQELKDHLNEKSFTESLELLVSVFPSKVVFSTSFGLEDQVITHKILSSNLDIKIVTLDTGRLFNETYKTFSGTIGKYGKKIHVYFPEPEHIEKMVSEKGPFSFYESTENRLECCRYRKVLPLGRALSGMEVWISGIRADQSENRSRMDWLEYDYNHMIFKFYPLFDWTFGDVRNFIRENNIPYNSLHDKGFISIGCEPCTRAVKEGEDFRAGRWWWESNGEKECGCHLK
jgi:phosphoadenosine phosphosulfate reductase